MSNVSYFYMPPLAVTNATVGHIYLKKVELIELLEENGNNPKPKPLSVLNASYGKPWLVPISGHI